MDLRGMNRRDARENSILKSSISSTHRQNYEGDKIKRVRGAGHVACMGEMKKNVTKFKLGSLKGRDHSESINVAGRIILK
jgi:hypothetical protein